MQKETVATSCCNYSAQGRHDVSEPPCDSLLILSLETKHCEISGKIAFLESLFDTDHPTGHRYF
jgi:hypothetical protein